MELVETERALAVFREQRQVGLTGAMPDGEKPGRIALAVCVQR
jgi:hypothetical protein